jgi:small-conductance mechanosensitive channel
MFAGVVKNFVRGDRVGRIVIPISVLWGSDPEKVREVLFEAAKSHDEVVGIPAPSVLFSKISSSSLDFELVCFVEDVERAARVKSDLHYTIFSRFAEAGLRLNPPPAAPQTLTLDLAQIEPLLKREVDVPKDIET